MPILKKYDTPGSFFGGFFLESVSENPCLIICGFWGLLGFLLEIGRVGFLGEVCHHHRGSEGGWAVSAATMPIRGRACREPVSTVAVASSMIDTSSARSR